MVGLAALPPSFPPLLGSLLPEQVATPRSAASSSRHQRCAKGFQHQQRVSPPCPAAPAGSLLCLSQSLLTDAEDAALGFSWRGCNGCLFKRELNLQIFDATRQSTYKPSILRDF